MSSFVWLKGTKDGQRKRLTNITPSGRKPGKGRLRRRNVKK